jgi:hypothetical protein
VTEIVNDSYSDACEIEDSSEHEEKYQEITPLEEADCLLVEQETVLELQPQRVQKRKCQAPMGGDLDGTRYLSHK